MLETGSNTLSVPCIFAPGLLHESAQSGASANSVKSAAEVLGDAVEGLNMGRGEVWNAMKWTIFPKMWVRLVLCGKYVTITRGVR